MQTRSFISVGLLKSNLKRFWPLWVIYLAVWLLVFVAPLSSFLAEISLHASDAGDARESLQHLWYVVRFACVPIVAMASLIVAVSLNDHLFGKDAAAFYGSLPAKRLSLFAATYASGFIALVGVAVVVALMLVGLHAVEPLFDLGKPAEWFALVLLLTFVFYSLAVFIAGLCGTRSVAVTLFLVVNVLAVCIEVALRWIVSALQYGYLEWGLALDWAAPLIGIMNRVLVTGEWGQGGVNWPALGAYCAVAAVLVVLACVLAKRRDLESAGDPIVVAPMRPVLKYLAGVSMALLFGAVACLNLAFDANGGMGASATDAVVLAAMMAVGGFLGVLFAEMAMRRTTHVFSRCWAGGLAVALLSVALVGVCFTDAFGVVSRVPDADAVESVTLSVDSDELGTFESAEAIEDAINLQRDVLDYGGKDSYSGLLTVVGFSYAMEDGSNISRSYPVYLPADEYEGDSRTWSATYSLDGIRAGEGHALLQRLADIAASDEGRRSRFAGVLALEGNENTYDLEVFSEDGDSEVYTIGEKQKADFIEHGLAPDLLELHAYDYSPDRDLTESETELSLYVTVTAPDGSPELSMWLDTEKTPNSIAWLKEHYPHLDSSAWQPSAREKG